MVLHTGLPAREVRHFRSPGLWKCYTATLDHDAEETRHRSHDLVRPNPNRCLRHVPGSDTRRRPEKDINTIVRTKIGAGPYSGVAQTARLRQRHGAPHWTPCPGSPAFSFARTVEMLHSKEEHSRLRRRATGSDEAWCLHVRRTCSPRRQGFAPLPANRSAAIKRMRRDGCEHSGTDVCGRIGQIQCTGRTGFGG